MYSQLIDERNTPRKAVGEFKEDDDDVPEDWVEPNIALPTGAHVSSSGVGAQAQPAGKGHALKAPASKSSGRARGQTVHRTKKSKRKQSHNIAKAQNIGRARQAFPESCLSSSGALE